MSFTLRLATCIFAVLALSVLAAWAWDASDPAAGGGGPAQVAASPAGQ